MSTIPLLGTKLNIPAIQPNLIERRNLTARLEIGLSKKLTLVSAPAGYGKTTLVCEWIVKRRQLADAPIYCWLSLDDGDNDPIRFLTYMIAALQTADPNIGTTAIELIQSPQTGIQLLSFENIITLLINDLILLSYPAVLVLDDYHVIQNLEIHKAISYLLDNWPAELHLLIISREDPTLPLHRLRANGELLEIRARDLRFSTEEAAAYFSGSQGLDLTLEDVEKLERRTEGWIVGLQLAALSMHGMVDINHFIDGFTGDDRYIADYLLAEVLNCLEPQIQEFLIKTAILEQFTAPLCDVILKRNDSIDTLAYLEGINLFLISLDSRREWYRYHRLFRDLLLFRLDQLVKADELRLMHLSAAGWYAQVDMIDDAIHHSLAAEDYHQTADLLETICSDLVSDGQFHKLLNLISAIPEDIVNTRPYLCVYHGWALGMSGQSQAVEGRLKVAENALESVPSQKEREIRGHIAILRSYQAYYRNDQIQAVTLLHKSLDFLPRTNLKERSIANSNLGVNYLALGKFEQASDSLQAAMPDRLAVGERWISIGATSYLADTYYLRGRLEKATALYMEAIDLGRNPMSERLFPVAGHACAGLGRILYEQGKIDEAQDYFVEAAELGESISFWGIVIRAYGPLVWAQFMQGETATAQETMQRALDIAAHAKRTWSNVHYDSYLMPLQVRLWLSSGEEAQAKAIRWAENYRRSRPDVSSYSQEFAQLILARVEISQDAHHQAIQRLETLARVAGERGGMDGLIKINVLKACAEEIIGDSSAAQTSLEHALDLAADEGYFQTFIDEGPVMLEMLGRCSHPYALQIIQKQISRSVDRNDASTVDNLQLPESLPEETLSGREIEVLRFLAAGLSYAEAAEKMFLSLNTIKWYVKKIYRKLGVNRRTHAIAKARKLGLLS